ncbi:MAG: efflux RND transporter permease subunit [Pirellulaceae bacterium]|nr:efflux RND transporter permease subunit [Pirellulaceae bacterium]
MTNTTIAHQHPVGRLAAKFYRDRRLIVLTLLLAVASGLSSLWVLPRMEDPLLTGRAGQIITVFPGADANRVEALVTEKIEQQLLDVPQIKRMRSQSRAGSSFVSIELRDEVVDPDPVWSDIRGKLEDSISLLPDGAMRPHFDELDISAYAWIGALVWDRSDAVADGVLRRMARELKDELYALTGTKSVDMFGDPQEQILVEIDPDHAAAAGIPASTIARQLQQGDVKSSAGMLRSANSEVVVELDNQFYSLEDILNTTLHTAVAGQTLRLSDVATVRRTTPEPVASKAIVDGRPGIVVAALLRPEFRIDQWAEVAQQKIAQFQQRLPSGISLDVIMQQQRYVDDRMESLLKNLFLGVSAVAVVTFLFLGWRSSLLVTATLPVAAFMVVAGMRFLGIPIHQMSITGLIIAMGLLIDNAIISADEIDISLRRGLAPVDAVRDMVSRLFAPLLASTVTTALAFAPIALMEGPAGEFVGSIALTVMLAIFSSLLLALTVLPASAAWLHRDLRKAKTTLNSMDSVGDHRATLHRDLHQATAVATATAAANHTSAAMRSRFVSALFEHGLQLRWLERAYAKMVTWLVAHPWIGVCVGCVLPAAGFVAATQLSEQFFPPADRDQFHVELELSPGTSLAHTEQVAREVDRVLMAEPRIEHTAWFLGESAPAFYYNIISRRKNSPNYAQAIVTLDDNTRPLELIRSLQRRLDEQFPESQLLVRQLEQGPPFDAPVELRLFGNDLEQLRTLGEDLRVLATQIPGVLHTRTALSDVRPVATVSVDARQADWAGLSESEIGQQLFARLEGLPAGSIIEQVEEIPVRVRMAGSQEHSLEQLAAAGLFVTAPPNQSTQAPSNQPLAGASGSAQSALGPTAPATIPIRSVSTIALNPQRAVITRFNGRRMNEVQGFITAGMLPSKVLHQLEERIASSGFELPPGFTLEHGGEASERDAAVGRLLANVSLLAVGMIAALVLALASFRLTALIGLVATLSIGLGMGALWLFGYPFGFMAIIGTMGLVGIAINDSIVVVAALSDDSQARLGDAAAIARRVMEVTRHVLATTATTVVGFLPLVLGGGDFWPPLAVCIGAGVTGATLISLTLVPSAFRLMSLQRAF